MARYDGITGELSVDEIFKRCTPRITTDIRDCGTLTACKAIIPSPNDLESMFANADGDFYIMNALFAAQFDLAMNQVEQSPFEKFLMSHNVNVSKRMSKQVIGPGQERIQPYILGFRRGLINNVQWYVTEGASDGGHWKVTVTSPTQIPVSADWFHEGEFVYITGLTADGVQTNTMWKVADNAIDVDVGHMHVWLDPVNSASFLPDARLGEPVNGILVRGPNNVDDFESFCKTIPGLITGNNEPFWFQTSRGPILCEDEFTREYRELILKGNMLYSKFFDLPLTEYNRQVGQDWTRRMAEAYMYNKGLPGQNLEQFMHDQVDGGLETITMTDFLTNTRCIGKRANAIGWYEQHAAKGRVLDLQGGNLSLPSLASALYRMKEIREAAGMKNADIFDLMMPSPMMQHFTKAFIEYWKARGVNSYDKVLDSKFEQGGDLGFRFRTFRFDWPDVEVRILTDRYFDHTLDIATKFGVAVGDPRYANLGRRIFIMAWPFNYVGILGSKRVVNSSGTLSERAKVIAADRCKMAVDSITTTMTSTVWCPISELPEADLILENIGDGPIDWQNAGNDYDTAGGACQEDTVALAGSSSSAAQ